MENSLVEETDGWTNQRGHTYLHVSILVHHAPIGVHRLKNVPCILTHFLINLCESACMYVVVKNVGAIIVQTPYKVAVCVCVRVCVCLCVCVCLTDIP